jgi:hypothetical protein
MRRVASFTSELLLQLQQVGVLVLGEVTRVAMNQDIMELIINYPDGRYLCLVRNDGTVQSLTRLGRQR